MSLQTQFTAPLIQRNEDWLSEKNLSASSKSRSVASSMQVLKAAISIVLLAGVFFLVVYYYDTSELLADARGLSVATIGMIIIALLANTLAAVLRFKVIATDIKHPIHFRRAMAIVGAGSLAGAIFFQIAGQLLARGVIAGRGGIPFAAVVVITAYERFIAAIVSALLALAGALFIFGNVYLDQASGGSDLIKIMCGLMAAAVAGALLGYGRMAAQSITPLLTRHFIRRCLAVIGLTLLVQIPMMVAYVVAARALSPHTSIADLIAASAIVMFAASVPISLAGWGVREMSAVVALGAIGVAAHAALAAAIIIGVGSMLVMGAIAAASLPGSTSKRQLVDAENTKSFDYYRALAWALPVAAATLVLFQIYVPIQSGLLNVNLADPVAMLGGVLFILTCARAGRLPQWRVAHINLAAAVATLVLAVSLLIGAYRFGWTNWAVTNRFLGWFVLLAYGATGALIVRDGQKVGFRTILLTFAGATAAIAGVEVFLVMVAGLGFKVPVMPTAVEGFSLNHNFFAFQLLMAMAATITAVRGASLRIVILALVIAGLYFAGSRSGWIAAVFVLATGRYLGAINSREILIAVLAAASAALIAASAALIVVLLPTLPSAVVPQFVPNAASTQERLVSVVGGLKLFLDHPVFGAGLGAFRSEMILASGGIPLLDSLDRRMAPGRTRHDRVYRFCASSHIHLFQRMGARPQGTGVHTDCIVLCGVRRDVRTGRYALSAHVLAADRCGAGAASVGTIRGSLKKPADWHLDDFLFPRTSAAELPKQDCNENATCCKRQQVEYR